MALTFKQYLQETTWGSMDNNPDLPRNVKQKKNELSKQPGVRPLGHGANSFVYQDTDNQHELNTVRRVSSSKKKRDDIAYRLYAEMIRANPELQQNPYLPRIEAITDGDDTREYKLERLVPFDSPKVGHLAILKAVMARMFTDEAIDKIKQRANDALVRYPQTPYSRHLMNAIARTIAIGVEDPDDMLQPNYMSQYIKDPALVKAMQAVASLLSNEGVYKDMHGSNFMWRMTGTMPQLVITDPLFQD